MFKGMWKKSSLNFMPLVGFEASKIWKLFFGKFTVQQVLKSFAEIIP